MWKFISYINTNILNRNRMVFFIYFISLLALSQFFSHSVVYSCTCPSGKYACEGDTMCCTGNGCPSALCDGYWHNNTCCDSRERSCERGDCIQEAEMCDEVKYCDEDEYGRPIGCHFEYECWTICKKYAEVNCSPYQYSGCVPPSSADTCSFCPTNEPTQTPTPSVVTQPPSSTITQPPSSTITQPPSSTITQPPSGPGCYGCATAACGQCSSTAAGWKCVCTGPVSGGGYSSCVGQYVAPLCTTPTPTVTTKTPTTSPTYNVGSWVPSAPQCTTIKPGPRFTSWTDKNTFTLNETITLKWSPPETDDPNKWGRGWGFFGGDSGGDADGDGWGEYWGNCCSNVWPGCSRSYTVYLDAGSSEGDWSPLFGNKNGRIFSTTDTRILSYDLAASTLTPGVHTWYVVARYGGSIQSATQQFTVTGPPGAVKGWIWDSTGQACGYSGKQANEIQPSQIEGDIAVTVDTYAGNWDPANLTTSSYTVEGVPQGPSKVLCASIPGPVDKPGFKYNLKCLNGAKTGVFSGSCAYVDMLTSSTTAHLGYDLVSAGWFQVIGGDVFAGCSNCIDSISLGLPVSSAVLGGFSGTLINGTAALFANSDVSVKDSTGATKITTDSNNKYYSKNMDEGDFWPENFTFTPPSSATELNSNCNTIFSNGKLNPDKIYKSSYQCTQNAIAELGASNYKLDKDGVVVIYVTGGGEIVFTDKFVSESSNKRIVFISEGSVYIDDSIGDAAPTTATSPHIQASVLAKESITFLHKATPDDTTVIVEGPLVAKDGSIDFDRDRGVSNGYPATVVKYNPIYLNAFNSGIGEVSISWVLGN
ncbi:hypothetical protein HYV31_01305 [candidate division WWE3 bacterium]|nr:hypothetical protein [candidate division WWE3 bacterium]